VAGNWVVIVVDGTIEIANATKPACVLQSVSRLYG